MGESKKITLDASLAQILSVMKDGEVLAAIRVHGTVDLYAGSLKQVGFDTEGGLHLTGVGCARETLTQADLKDHVQAEQIAKLSVSEMDFGNKALLKLMGQAVKAKVTAELETATIAPKPLVYPVPGLNARVLSSTGIQPGEIFVAQHSATKPGQLDIHRLADMPCPGNEEITQFYNFIYEKNLEIMKMDWFKQYDQSPSPSGPWDANVSTKTGETLTEEEIKSAFEKTKNEKVKPDHPGFYTQAQKPVVFETEKCDAPKNEAPHYSVGFDIVKKFAGDEDGQAAADAFVESQSPIDKVKIWHEDECVYVGVAHGKFTPQSAEETIAGKIDSIAQQDAEFKIKDLEKKILKLNPDHAYVGKLKLELLAMKKKLEAQKKNPIQVLENTVKMTPVEEVICGAFDAHGFKVVSGVVVVTDDGYSVRAVLKDAGSWNNAHLLAVLEKLGFGVPNPPVHLGKSPEGLDMFQFKLVAIAKMDVDAQIKHAFEGAGVAVVKVLLMNSSSGLVQAVFEKSQFFNKEPLDNALAEIGWKRDPDGVKHDHDNPDGSKVFNIEIYKSQKTAPIQITHAFESANVAVVKVSLALESSAKAVAQVVIEQDQNVNLATLDEALAKANWMRTGKAPIVQQNPNGSTVQDVYLQKIKEPGKISQDEFAKAIGASEYGPIGTALTAGVAGGIVKIKQSPKSEPVTIGVDQASVFTSSTSSLVIQTNGKMVVTIKPDGQIVLGEGVTADGAAAAFWDAIAAVNPLGAQVKNLTQKLMLLETAHDHVIKKLRRYEGDPNQPPEQNPIAARFRNVAGNL